MATERTELSARHSCVVCQLKKNFEHLKLKHQVSFASSENATRQTIVSGLAALRAWEASVCVCVCLWVAHFENKRKAAMIDN